MLDRKVFNTRWPRIYNSILRTLRLFYHLILDVCFKNKEWVTTNTVFNVQFSLFYIQDSNSYNLRLQVSRTQVQSIVHWEWMKILNCESTVLKIWLLWNYMKLAKPCKVCKVIIFIEKWMMTYVIWRAKIY